MKSLSLKHLAPLAIVLCIAVAAYVFGLHEHFTLEKVREKEHLIFSLISLHPFLSALTFVALYIVSTCLLIPSFTVLTLVIAMTYPFPYAMALSVLSETLGTCLFFLILRFAFRPHGLYNKIPYTGKAAKEFHKNPASYLLFLRLSHLTPSWLISTLAAIFKARPWTFIWTTFIGTVPVCYLVVQAGKTIKHTKSGSYNFNWHELFNTDVKLLFLAMGILALAPIFIKRFLKR